MKSVHIIPLVVLAATGAAAYAQAPAAEQAPASAPAAVEMTAEQQAAILNAPLQQDPKIITGKLENGLTYIIRPTAEPAGRACLRLHVATGSQDEQKETSGLSHFIEHLVFNGSRTFKRGELIPAMQEMGLGFGGDANAYTSLLHTLYMINMPNLKDETVNLALTIVRDFADGATLTDEAIDHERGIVISELKSRQSASYNAQIASLGQMTPGTRVAEYLPIGLEEVIRDVEYETVRKFYHDHYVPERMTLIITGDVTVEQAEEWVRKYFSSMESRKSPQRPHPGNLDPSVNPELIVQNEEDAYVNMMASLVKPYEKKADTLEQRIEDLPLKLACAMLSRRMERMALEEGSPFMAAGADATTCVEVSEVAGLSVRSEPGKWKEALSAAEQELRRAIQYGFSPVELQEVTSATISGLQQSVATWPSVTAETMAGTLVDCVNEYSVCTAPEENLRVFVAGLQKVLSNPDCCRAALAKAWEQNKAARLYLSGAVPEGISTQDLREVWNASLATAVDAPVVEELKPFAYDHIGEPGKVIKREEVKDLGVTTLTLSNGVRVNLKQLGFQKGSISVNALVDGGSLLLPRIPGLDTMISAVMGAGGLEEHSMEELERLLSGHQVGMNFSMGADRMSFSGVTGKQDLELQCKLLAACIMHPGYRPEAERLLRRNLPAAYQRMRTTTDGVLSMNAKRILLGDDKRFVTPTEEEVAATNTEMVREHLTPFLKDGAMEVTLVGDFAVDEIIPVLERTFGAMPQRRAEFTPITDEMRKVNFQPWGKREFLRAESELDKTIVAQVRPAGNGRDRVRNRRLQVLSAIVREKLFDGIRAQMGETYSPQVSVFYGTEFDDAAYITTISAGVKRNRVKVNAAMDCICQELASDEGISEEDFQRALRPILTSIDKQTRSTGYWVNNLKRFQSDPEQIGLIRSISSDFASITLEEIRQIAKEIFGCGKTQYLFVVPEDFSEEAENAAIEEEETPIEAAEEAHPIAKAAPAAMDPRPAPAAKDLGSPYTIIISQATAVDPEWRNVALALKAKYANSTVVALASLDQKSITAALRKTGARYAACVLKPEECVLATYNDIHRAARKVDDDIWGDCMWGIVTGYTAADAMRIATATEPLKIKRLLGTTNVGAGRFESSYCITDWTNYPVLTQEGYTEPTTINWTADTPEGRDVLTNGVQGKFAERLAGHKPEFIVTSSHATQFNLEMPFSRGLIFPADNRFYAITPQQMDSFRMCLSRARMGQFQPMQNLPKQLNLQPIQPDGTTRVWLAAGNCLFGNAEGTNQSMAVTALSAYTCNQVVGYTVPSWYGAGGWGTLGTFMESVDGISLAEAWFMNNQFILNSTKELDPVLLNVEFNDDTISNRFQYTVAAARPRVRTEAQVKDALGLVHDRDVVVFYGDPAWSASVDSTKGKSPFTVTWNSPKSFTITANYNHKGRCPVWFPMAETGKDATGCDAKGAIFTNDFILFPNLEMLKGETLTVTIK